MVSMGNGIFLANRIDDAFAVVDAGAPGVCHATFAYSERANEQVVIPVLCR
jgi:outer membrane usher protein FimD/PapC